MLRNTTPSIRQAYIMFKMTIYHLNVTDMQGGMKADTIIKLKHASLLSRQWTMKRKVPCWEFKIMNST